MLVVSRKRNQTIVLETAQGEVITFTICKAGTTVSVGVKAPKDVKIRRGEIPEDTKGAA